MSVQSKHQTSMQPMLEVYKSVLYDEGIHYCSAPITSGRRYLKWLKVEKKLPADIDELDQDERSAHFREVIEPNRLHAKKVIHKLRQQTDQVVIDPTAIPPIPGWTQEDWRDFWRQVIEQYITIIFFVDDWQYSNGCVYEFLIAQKKGIPSFNEYQSVLDLDSGIKLIEQATAEIEHQGAATGFIRKVLSQLKSL